MESIALFSGSSHPFFTQHIASHLSIPLSEILSRKFPDGEYSIELLESVRGKQAFIVQSIAIDPNDYLMELLILVDAIKRASAKSITAIIPYFGYCRQDRKGQKRAPITAKLVADLLQTAGVNRLITMDLHAEQLQGFFNIPVENLYSLKVLSNYLLENLQFNGVVVAPDSGSAKIASRFAKEMHCSMALINKERLDAKHIIHSELIGNVQGKDVLLADDICSTGATLASAAMACREKGALNVYAAITHGLFTDGAIHTLENSCIDRVFYCDTVPQKTDNPLFEKVSVSSLFAQVIEHMSSDKSISSLFHPSSKAVF